MDNDAQDISTQMDDVSSAGQSAQDLLDAVMRNSPIMDELDIPLPEEEASDVDPVETDEVEDPSSEEVVSEDDEEEVEELDEETAEQDDTSILPEVYTIDDLDLDAKVSVKIDGEETEVSFGDLVKGYSTEQSLSKKGRELGEARKSLEAERAEKIGQLESAAAASVQLLASTEQNFAKEYHDVEAAIAKARADGDTFEVNELKDKREIAQQKYWGARRQREGLIANVQKQKQECSASPVFKSRYNISNKTIPDIIPDFSEDVANKHS